MTHTVGAAARSLIFLSWMLFLKSDSPKQLAEVYVKEKLSSFGNDVRRVPFNAAKRI